MTRPENDLKNRQPVWDALQMFWMDTDPNYELEGAVNICAISKYSIHELELIYWNEVLPAVSSNLRSPAPEWAGFDSDWLAKRILEKNRFGRSLRFKFMHFYANHWWKKLRKGILDARGDCAANR